MPQFIRLESCATFFELVIRSPLHLLQSLFSSLLHLLCRYLAHLQTINLIALYI